MIFAILELRSLAKERNKREDSSRDAFDKVKQLAERWGAIAAPLGIPSEVNLRGASDALYDDRIRDGLLAVAEAAQRAAAIEAYDALWTAMRDKEHIDFERYTHAIRTEKRLQRLNFEVWTPLSVLFTVGVGYWLGSLVNMTLVGAVTAASLAVISAHGRFVDGQDRAEKNIDAWAKEKQELSSIEYTGAPSLRWAIEVDPREAGAGAAPAAR